MSRECGEQLPSEYDGENPESYLNGICPNCGGKLIIQYPNQMVDETFIPDSYCPKCKMSVPTEVRKTCPKCGEQMEQSKYLSMGDGYSEWEHFQDGQLIWSCEFCHHMEEVLPSFQEYSDMEQGGHPIGK